MSKKSGHGLTTLFTLALCCMFAISVLAVLLLGVDIYRGVAEQGMSGYGERTCLAYIAAKLHRSDTEGGVYVTEFEGASALEFAQEIGGRVYVTTIYLWDGSMRELFREKGLTLPAGMGNIIGSASSLEFSAGENGTIVARCDAGNGETSAVLYPRSGGGVR